MKPSLELSDIAPGNLKIGLKPSPTAAAELIEAIANGLSPFDYEADEIMGQTDCEEGCSVEPDGQCAHGYLSAARTEQLV